jgi:hypothetical protein
MEHISASTSCCLIDPHRVSSWWDRLMIHRHDGGRESDHYSEPDVTPFIGPGAMRVGGDAAAG